MSQPISNRIYVAGLDGKVSAAELRAYFEKFGELTDVYIPNNHQTGQPKHFGFVTFSGGDSSANCLGTPMHEINGQSVELKPCVPKDQMGPKGGGKGDAGAAGVLGGMPGLGGIPGLGLQPGLMQPALGQPAMGGLGLQALQQQMMMQQQQQQLQLYQLLAKMQQPQQQFLQPGQMMPGQYGALPAAGLDLGAGYAAAQGSAQPFGMMPTLPQLQPGIADASTAAGSTSVQPLTQQVGAMPQFAMPMLGMPPQQFAAPAAEASPEMAQLSSLMSQPASFQAATPADALLGGDFSAPVSAYGTATAAADPAQGATRYAPY